MTKAQEVFRKQLLSKIHQLPFVQKAKEQEAWEVWLGERYGVPSCSALSIDELRNVLDVINHKAPVKTGGRRPVQSTRGGITEKQKSYILKLWEGRSNDSLLKFAQHTLGVIPLSLDVLSSAEATKLITGIEYMQGVKKR